MGDIFGVMIPYVGMIVNGIKKINVSIILDKLATPTAGALLVIDTEMAAIKSMLCKTILF